MPTKFSHRKIAAKLAAEAWLTYGHECWLKMPGCTGYADTLDHVLPFRFHGQDSIDNLRPACRHCNSYRHDRIISGYGATIHVVTGAPAAGKSTYVQQHAGLNDVVLDFDALANCLMPNARLDHAHPMWARRMVAAAWNAARREAERVTQPVDIWIIKTMPLKADGHTSLLTEWVALHYDIIVIDPGLDVVASRITSGQRPPDALERAKRWYRLGVKEQLASLHSLHAHSVPPPSERPRL